ncbi:malto-oligosyltrehalose synthase [Microbacterium koreense]|uniref:Malto-oligosyltrehalose synthase n=1 Tax=Microbacterium koreense TaxID=323761 RepID=A0ABW2ZPA1_9MICO
MRHVPQSTYRLQIRPSFTLDDAVAIVPYLRDLGVSWVYLSPLLVSTTGSDHGYDVVDPTRVDPARGGTDALVRFSRTAHAAGLGILVDIVPNHMGISAPRENAWWWDVLRLGQRSAYARFFDIDWVFGDGKVRVPVLGAPLAEILDRDELSIDLTPAADAPDGVIRYFDHAFPLAPGTGGADVETTLDAQHFELRFWQDEAADLNYRRFFGVTTLAGVRIEDSAVFDETHREIVRWVREGLVDGLRVDHPDGLVDPGAYFDRLADATDGAYVLIEKILEHGEELPSWWCTDGTTGYDALAEIDRVLTDPAGESALDDIDTRLRSGSGLEPARAWPDLIHDTKRMIADTIQVSEIRRLVREMPETVPDVEDALAELLTCFPVYRSYLPAGAEHLHTAARDATRRRPDLAPAIAALVPVLSDPANVVARRFQQTTGPVMAKGVEDTAFYRFTRLGSLTEVGGDPSVFAQTVAGFHATQAERLAAWPHAMTTLSTHDTKRGEDVRARLAVLAEVAPRWDAVLGALRGIASTGHGPFDALLWQAIIGSWPASPERLHAYAEKAAREAAESTGWWNPDADFERAMARVVDAAFGAARPLVDSFVDEIAAAGWSNGLSAKVLQLAGPGVPDVYQGSELWEQSLVDPDNRRPVDFTHRADLLASIDAGAVPAVDADGTAKLLVTARALRLRRERPELFERYRPLTAVGAASGHMIAADRGGASFVTTRLPVGLDRAGGWRDTVLLRPKTPVVDVISGRTFAGGPLSLADLLRDYPVALLVEES